MTNKELKNLLTASIQHLSILYDQSEAESIANLLAQNVFGITRSELFTSEYFDISESALSNYHEALSNLKKGVPLQHITGTQLFYKNDFKVSPDVLIPRPETEEMVGTCIEENNKKGPLHILDLCTGSGCIAITLDLALPDAKVDALELSTVALQIARHNNDQLGADIKFLHEDIMAFQPKMKYDIIISNPPYILDSEKTSLHRNVIDHEPHEALFVEDHKSLIFYEKIASLLDHALKPGGKIYLEINEAKGAETLELFNESFKSTEIRKDFFGKDRFLVGTSYLGKKEPY